MLRRLTRTRDDYAVTLARLALGTVFFAHGSQKMLGWFGGGGFSNTMQGFERGGMSAALAFFVIFVEFFGGLSMLVGLLSRLAGLGIAAVMVGAILRVHQHVGFFMNWSGRQKGEGYEFHILAIALAAVVMVRGAGALSADGVIAKALGSTTRRS